MSIFDKVKTRDQLGWLVGAIVYVVGFFLFVPFLIAGVYLSFGYTYDYNEVGAESTAYSFNLIGQNETQVFSVQTEIFANATFQALSYPISNTTVLITNVTSTLAPILGAYTVRIFANVDAEGIPDVVLKNFTLPLVQRFNVTVKESSSPTEVLMVKNDIQKEFQSLFLTRFGNEITYYNKVATLSAEENIRSFFEAETFRDLYDAIRPVDSPELTAGLTALYGTAYITAFAPLSALNIVLIHLKPINDFEIATSTRVAYYCSLPQIIISFLVTIASSIFVFVKRKEPEVRSKYMTFLVCLFTALYCSYILFIAVNFVLVDPINNTAAITFLATVLHFTFPCFFSVLNCRHRMMYSLFVLKKPNPHFFLPLIWHSMLLLLLSFVVFFAFQDFDAFESAADVNLFHVYLVYILVIYAFFAEGLYYTWQTRNVWNMFVDTNYNIRTFAVYIIFITPVCIVLMTTVLPHKMAFISCIFSFFYGVIPCCYLLDSLILPFLKIHHRGRGRSFFPSLNFEAQISEIALTDVNGILKEKRLRKLLLAYSKDQHCDENIRFLIDLQDLKASLLKIKFIELYEEYCTAGSPSEVNLNDAAVKTTKTGLERIQDVEDEHVKYDQVVYAFNNAEVEIIKLVRENTLKGFLALPEVISYIEEQKHNSDIVHRLALESKSDVGTSLPTKDSADSQVDLSTTNSSKAELTANMN